MRMSMREVVQSGVWRLFTKPIGGLVEDTFAAPLAERFKLAGMPLLDPLEDLDNYYDREVTAAFAVLMAEQYEDMTGHEVPKALRASSIRGFDFGLASRLEEAFPTFFILVLSGDLNPRAFEDKFPRAWDVRDADDPEVAIVDTSTSKVYYLPTEAELVEDRARLSAHFGAIPSPNRGVQEEFHRLVKVIEELKERREEIASLLAQYPDIFRASRHLPKLTV